MGVPVRTTRVCPGDCSQRTPASLAQRRLGRADDFPPLRGTHVRRGRKPRWSALQAASRKSRASGSATNYPYESRWRVHSAVKRDCSRTRSVAMTSAASAARVSATPSSSRRWLVGASTGHAGVVAASLRRRQSRRRVRPCCLRDGACRPAGLRLAHRPVADLATSRARVVVPEPALHSH
jgi:hypothetical protein